MSDDTQHAEPQHVEGHAAQPQHAEVFTFGDPEPVMEARDILDLLEAWWNQKYYEPPISLHALSKSFRANPHHSSAIYVKRNLLVSTYAPHPLLPKREFSRFALEYLAFGNGYLHQIENRLGGTWGLRALPAKYTRVGTDDTYWWVPGPWGEQELPQGRVFHLAEPDLNQEIYGVPEYLSGLQAAWLNEAATLFRRKYYLNGSHAGFILYMTDPAHDEEDIKQMRQALKEAKGPGNFRNLFMYAPQGKKDGIQVIPIAEVQAKDEFFNVKSVSRDDVLAAHRVPPELMGVVPQNIGGFGDVTKAAQVFARNELGPLQERMKELNEWMGEEVVRFRPYALEPDDSEPPDRRRAM